MADASGDVCSVLCGGCCLVFFSSLTAYCGTKRYGAGNGSSRPAGCCGSCCNDSFDEDAFDEQVKKDMAKTRDPNAKQPEPTDGMSPATATPAPAADGVLTPTAATSDLRE